MAYQGYSDQPGNYGQSQSYGGPSPYQQAGNPYDQDTSYNGGNPYAQGQYDRQEYEMSNTNGMGANRLLNTITQLNTELDTLDEEDLQKLQALQRAYVTDPNPLTLDRAKKQSDALVGKYGGLVTRVKQVKQDKESGNPRNSAQVGKLDRRIKKSMQGVRQMESKFSADVRDIMAREYRIVKPEASETEVRQVVESNNSQVFTQAIMSSDRRGQVNSTRQQVHDRHMAVQEIEKDMVQLAALFQDLDALVVQQESTVAAIEERGEETVVHGNKANEELSGAVDKARAARKKKFICLGIGIAIVVVIVVVVVVVVEVVKK